SVEPIPMLSHARRLPLMYEALAGSSPTRTTARCGARRPAATCRPTTSERSLRISWASASPSTTIVSTGAELSSDLRRRSWRSRGLRLLALRVLGLGLRRRLGLGLGLALRVRLRVARRLVAALGGLGVPILLRARRGVQVRV